MFDVALYQSLPTWVGGGAMESGGICWLVQGEDARDYNRRRRHGFSSLVLSCGCLSSGCSALIGKLYAAGAYDVFACLGLEEAMERRKPFLTGSGGVSGALQPAQQLSC